MVARRTRTETIDDLFVSTYQKAERTIRDNVFNPQQSALWAMMRAKGGFVSQLGGDFIKIDLEIGQNTNIQAVGKGETVNLQDFQHLDQARYTWAFYDIPIVRYWHDDQENAGMAQIVNMIMSKIRNTTNTYAELMEQKLFGDNSTNPKEMNGLQHLVSDSVTGSRTIGEIDQSNSDNSWWRNQSVDFGSTYGTTDAAWLTNGVEAMRLMKQDCLGKTDLIVTSQHIFNLMQDDLLTYFEWDGKLAADLGLPTNTPMFDGVPVMWSRQCGNRMYFLDLDAIKFYYDPRDFITLGPWKDIPNQPKDRVAHVTLVCSFVVKERRAQGVLHNLPAAS